MADKSDEKLVQKAKDCFKAALEAEAQQREREKEDLAFQIPENQWEPAAKKYREGTATSPGRPMLSVSLLSQPMQLIQNQATQAQLGVEVHPVSENADPEVAEIKQGLYRRIERDSNAQLARLWAFDRAKQCGRGWYRVNTQWDEDSDNEFDQEIVIERIHDQSTVYIDPAAVKPDFSDARWALIVNYVPVDAFKADYPDAEVPETDAEFKAWMDAEPEWVQQDGETKSVLVAEYFYKVIKSVEVKSGDRKRNKDFAEVKVAHITAKGVAYKADWMGNYIPLIPVIGVELQPFDGKRIWKGMVRDSKDAQRFANYSISTVAEVMAQEPKTTWVGAEGQFRGHEDEWLQANVRNTAYLEYRPISHDGNLAPPPQRSQADTSKLGMALNAFSQARELVQSATSVYAPSLGEMPKQQTAQSGRAILALQQQSDAGTGQFLQNLATISMPYEARVVLNLMPKVYDRVGRVVQILGDEDEQRAVMLKKPFAPDESGRPVAVPPPAPGMKLPPEVKTHDLSKGKYSVSVNIGKSFQTRLQEGRSVLGELIQNVPPPFQMIMLPTFLKFLNSPGSKELSDLAKAFRDKQFPGLGDKEGQQPSPEQLKAQIEGMGQQMQQMQQALQMATQKLETDQAKQQAAIMKAQLDAQSSLQKAQIDAETKLQISAADNATKLEIANLSARVDEMLTLLKVQGEAYKVEAQAQHDDEQAERSRQHDAAMGELGRPEPEEPEPAEKDE